MSKARVWLKQIRQKEKLTQEQAANLSCISKSHYAQIESGSRTPSVAAAKRIAKMFNFSWHIFFETKLHNSCNVEYLEMFFGTCKQILIQNN